MPKQSINYQNTEIYKIVCDDTPEFYVGHTTNFIKRKQNHKRSCNIEKDRGYNFKIYKTIREFGGWDNWRMVLVEKFPCENKREAEKREEEIRVELKATLNTNRAWSDGKCFVEECDNGAVKGGVCVKHGAIQKRCSIQDCNNKSRRDGVCVKHGAVMKRCSIEECENQSIKDGLCVKHGAILKRCSVDGCENMSQKGGICIKHGAVMKRCSIEDCENQSVKGGLCVKHGAIRKRCSIEDCENQTVKGGLCHNHSPQYTCEVCNKLVKSANKTRHEKTKMHLNNLNKI
jgi:hypothetical protein